jgi:predicted acyltransferase
MLVGGVAVAVLGLALDRVLMPINKSLWTPSYCVFMTGLALIVFAAFHAAMDGASSERMRRFARRLALPLTIFGMNALFIFAFSSLVARLLAPVKPKLYAPFQGLPFTPQNASLAYALVFWLAMFVVAWFMWRKRWFVKA